jgi:hypothetical protein
MHQKVLLIIKSGKAIQKTRLYMILIIVLRVPIPTAATILSSGSLLPLGMALNGHYMGIDPLLINILAFIILLSGIKMMN